MAIVLIVLGVLILAYLSWVVIKPILAARHCTTSATDQAEKNYHSRQVIPVGGNTNQNPDDLGRDQQYEDDFQYAYTLCMEERGFAE